MAWERPQIWGEYDWVGVGPVILGSRACTKTLGRALYGSSLLTAKPGIDMFSIYSKWWCAKSFMFKISMPQENKLVAIFFFREDAKIKFKPSMFLA